MTWNKRGLGDAFDLLFTFVAGLLVLFFFSIVISGSVTQKADGSVGNAEHTLLVDEYVNDQRLALYESGAVSRDDISQDVLVLRRRGCIPFAPGYGCPEDGIIISGDNAR